MDAGPSVARRAVHVMPGESAADLWRRALAPLGIELFKEVIEKIERGEIPSAPQEEWAATWEPGLRRAG
jgi:methionyl-tRNA formyltransferase